MSERDIVEILEGQARYCSRPEEGVYPEDRFEWKAASEITRRRAENEALQRRVEEAKRDSFTMGYLIATANIMNLHGEDVIAEDVLLQLCETEGVIKRLDLSDYDAKPLRKLFRNISRKEKHRRVRAHPTPSGSE